jgi:hypothetical protein
MSAAAEGMAERVARGLERVLTALAQGDAEGARAAAQDAADACASLSAQGVRLAPDTAAALADACARAEQAAGGILGRVGGELSGAARSRRAAAAYGAPTSPHRHLP